MRRLLLNIFLIATIISCHKDTVQSGKKSIISGVAVKGYINGGEVNVYQYLGRGKRGPMVGNCKTDSKGCFEIIIDHRGATEITVEKGYYIDEASGTIVNLGKYELRSIVYLNQGVQNVAVTALTSIAAKYIDNHESSDFEKLFRNANLKVAKVFGIEDVDISKEIPADLSNPSASITTAQLKYGAIQAGLSQLIQENNLSAEKLADLITDFSVDFSDGTLDGKSGSETLETDLTITPHQAINGLQDAIINFLNSPDNKSNYYFAL